MSPCGEVRYSITRTRDEWRARLVRACSRWADEGADRCAQWADRGAGRCGDQAPSSWFRDVFYRVADLLGQAWYRLANRVCRAFAWVLYWVLTAVAYVVWLVLWIPCRVFGPVTRPEGRIRHVFVLVLENRSFDHMLGVSTGTVDAGSGFRPGVGVDAVSGAPTTVNGPSASLTNTHDGQVFAVRAGAPFVMPVDPPHEFCDVQLQLASVPITGTPRDDTCHYGGSYPALTMQGFVDNYANQAVAKGDASALADLGAVMACFTPDQVPVISALAREFAVCDNWFCALPGPTWPNRFFLHAATSGGLDRSPDPLELAASQVDGYQFENGTIYDALDSKGCDWQVYQGDALPQVSALAGMDLPTMLERFHGLDELAGDLRHQDFAASYVFIEPSYGHVLSHGGNFRCGNSQHPIDDVTRGEALIKYVYESIRQSPHWESSLLVITYDEHGGFYDHVEPPAAVPPGDVTDPAHNSHGFRFDRLGVRVPAVIVSPWVPAVRPSGPDGRNCNLIDHTVYDHGSLLASVERLYHLPSLTLRDAGANDFLHLLSAAEPRGDASLTLPAPADSGFTCDDEGDGGAPVGPGEGPVGVRTTADRPISSTLQGFLQVAALHDARLHPAERERIVRQLRSVHTVRDAHGYLTQVLARLDAAGLRTDIAAPSPRPDGR
ncbi:alkaline phosphatase family protein [Kitasatospora sp. MY 5-36]|uniref:alkaline phosphatase family protein n=1 Tax=Kitasatospora sp. MY 5-36 TaxID=1678027 RepID=UPI0006715922|nr:alkaline phosphatase family protein [Kitasatospora sp. MY 5-36]